MPRARLRVCNIPGCGTLTERPKCPEHSREYERERRANGNGSKGSEPRDRARRKAAVDEHRRQHGDICPGWKRPPHPSTDLTADHVIEVKYGGEPFGPLQVLCRSCNSSKSVTQAHQDGVYREPPGE